MEKRGKAIEYFLMGFLILFMILGSILFLVKPVYIFLLK